MLVCQQQRERNIERKRRLPYRDLKDLGVSLILIHHQVHHIMDKEVHQLPTMAVVMEAVAHLDKGVEPYPMSLTKGVRMMWIQKISSFSMHVGCHSMFFAHLIGMKWFLPLMMPPKDTRALGMSRPEPWDLIMKKLK